MRLRNGLLTVILAGLLILGIAAFLPQAAPVHAAEDDNPVRTLSVMGRGELKVKPDTAVITVGVSEVKPTPIEAYNALSDSINKVAEALKAKGVKEEELQTSMFQLAAEYNWTQERGQELVGYRATNTLSITTQDLDKVAELIQAAVQAGANDLRGVTFQVKNADKLLDDALKLAVADAKAKAELVAGELGARWSGSTRSASRTRARRWSRPGPGSTWTGGRGNRAGARVRRHLHVLGDGFGDVRAAVARPRTQRLHRSGRAERGPLLVGGGDPLFCPAGAHEGSPFGHNQQGNRLRTYK